MEFCRGWKREVKCNYSEPPPYLRVDIVLATFKIAEGSKRQFGTHVVLRSVLPSFLRNYSCGYRYRSLFLPCVQGSRKVPTMMQSST
eukprot:scaffold7227_cov90-Skeletonema_marinoi.AAC.1